MSGVFNPQGPIASQERDLIITAVIIMLVIAIPMLIALFTIAWRYRAGNKDAKYEADHVGGFFGQIIWWAILAAVIVALGVIDWKSTHALDPLKPIVGNAAPLTIQVVALDWKWLFIYPAQNIATVNFIQVPIDTPLHFELTADAPMNSFWIPQLGSQEYAMQGMVNQLYLEADAPGQYVGKAAEINGEGYSGMTFITKATSQADFNGWVASVQQSTSTYSPLNMDTYNALAAPSENNPPAFYSSVDPNLYVTIVMKFMAPASSTMAMPSSTSSTNAMEMSSSDMPMMPANMPGMQM
jgi:cytochrome o ubiquinol oxidase subunit 2